MKSEKRYTLGYPLAPKPSWWERFKAWVRGVLMEDKP